MDNKKIDKRLADVQLTDTSKERQDQVLKDLDDKTGSNFLIGVCVLGVTAVGFIMFCYWLFEMVRK